MSDYATYYIEQRREPSEYLKDFWSTEASGISGIEAAVEIARVMREARGQPTRVKLCAPPEPRLPYRWET